MLRNFAILTGFLALLGCSDDFLNHSLSADKNFPATVDVVRINAANIADYSIRTKVVNGTTVPISSGAWSYTIGSGDSLVVTVFDNPELNGSVANSKSEFLVGASGEIFYPHIGAVYVAGKSLSEVRLDIIQRLATYIRDPQVDVQVARFESQSVIVSGAVKQPQPLNVTTSELRVSDALALVGGTLKEADFSVFNLTRGGKNYSVAYSEFLEGGSAADNPRLLPGDVLNVPELVVREAYILGETQIQSAVDLTYGDLSLTQAISRNGGIDQLRGDARGVFVFRGNSDSVTVYQIDTSTPAGLNLGTRFMLKANDVVYVARTPLQRWNDTISKILPSLSLANVN
jgi:polysaccharide export outer membrane protein